MHTLILKPLATDYSVTPPSGIKVFPFSDRSTRKRVDVLEGAYFAQVVWGCSAEEFEYFHTFYRGTTQEGALTFLGYVHTIEDSKYCQLKEVSFVPNSVSWTPLPRGGRVKVAATLEIKATPITTEAMLQNQAIEDSNSFDPNVWESMIQLWIQTTEDLTLYFTDYFYANTN